MKTDDKTGTVTRRAAMAGALAAAPAVAWSHNASDDLAKLDATATAKAIADKHITAAEAVEGAIRRAEALQPKLNFLVAADFDRALDKAKRGRLSGPFAGVPFLVKDLDDYIGLPTRSGSRATAGAKPATSQSAYMDCFDRAGLVVIGKSATPEYGYLPTTEPLAFGPTRNPWDPSRSSGGSSGGAASATAAHVTPFAHASDGGGSIRIPSSNCGLFGLKPSRKRMIPGDRQEDPIGISVMHCTARTVRDSAALFALTERQGADAVFAPVGHVTGPSKRRLRVGLVTKSAAGLPADAEVEALILAQAKLLRELGHQVVETAWPVEGGQFTHDFLLYWAAGAAKSAQEIGQALGHAPDATVLEPFSLGMAGMVAQAKPGELGAASQRLVQAVSAYAAWFKDLDVVLSPVLRTPPPPLGFVSGDVAFPTLVERLTAYVGYTPLHNVAGAPSMSVPAGLAKGGLPVGAQYAAKAGDERTLFELAYELEAAHPWRGLASPIHG